MCLPWGTKEVEINEKELFCFIFHAMPWYAWYFSSEKVK
jgi:hypothetical protein